MRRFHECVEKESDAQFLAAGGIVTEIIEQQEDELKNFEVELVEPNKDKIVPGTKIIPNSKVPKEALTLKNQFAKLNFSQFTPHTIKIR